jgi:hypothetical protein
MSKLKTNKTFIKERRTKIINQKNKDYFPLIWKTNILSLFMYLSKEKKSISLLL